MVVPAYPCLILALSHALKAHLLRVGWGINITVLRAKHSIYWLKSLLLVVLFGSASGFLWVNSTKPRMETEADPNKTRSKLEQGPKKTRQKSGDSLFSLSPNLKFCHTCNKRLDILRL